MSPFLLHSSANQYNINGFLCTYTEMFRIHTCCNHILSAAEGFRGRRQHARIQDFCHYSRGVQILISIETHIRTCYFPGGEFRTPYPPLDPHMGNVIITGQYLYSPASNHDCRHALSGLMTGEVFQMMHCYCARLTHSRNTTLGSGSFCNSAFFLQTIHYLNAVSRTISVTG